jgi:Uma2 family endonuclease
MDNLSHISRADFRRWAEGQPNGRFERIDGQVVRMTPERVVHARLRAEIWRALDDAIRAAGLSAQALPDGISVEVGEDTDYEPDALVNLGAPPAPDDVAAANPVVVVEVLSPGSRSIDTGEKLAGYFRVPSIQHYLVVNARRREVVQHRRSADGIFSVVVVSGNIQLDPPGLVIGLDAIYQRAGL